MGDHVTDWLEQGHIRATKQRRHIATILIGDGKHRHVTAETVFAAAQKSEEPVSLATVYNTLHTFCDAGLLKEITVDGSKSYFDTNTHDHPHYFWEEEGHLSDAPADQLKIAALPKPPAGAEIAKVDVIIRLRKAD
ncbi:MAG: Fur family transcriptional regulator Irr [Paracoccaceae bacterium]|jgi:Fur family iron response transcriptional regulator